MSLCLAGGRGFERNLIPGCILKISGLGEKATQDTIGLFLNALALPKGAAEASSKSYPAADVEKKLKEGEVIAPAPQAPEEKEGDEMDEAGHLRFVEHDEEAKTAVCRFANGAAAAKACKLINAKDAEALTATDATEPKAEVLT